MIMAHPSLCCATVYSAGMVIQLTNPDLDVYRIWSWNGPERVHLCRLPSIYQRSSEFAKTILRVRSYALRRLIANRKRKLVKLFRSRVSRWLHYNGPLWGRCHFHTKNKQFGSTMELGCSFVCELRGAIKITAFLFGANRKMNMWLSSDFYVKLSRVSFRIMR